MLSVGIDVCFVPLADIKARIGGCPLTAQKRTRFASAVHVR